jgi:Lhr-like helicase
MDVFDLDQSLISDYERFARSFTQIRSADICQQIDFLCGSRRFWPEPLISVNPNYEWTIGVDDLVGNGVLRSETAQVFRIDGEGIKLYRHQEQAVVKAAAGKSSVVTTGTGSGKSLCFFVPIIDRAIRARASGDGPRTKAIVIYPMNALANSQMEELEKFLKQSGLPQQLLPTYARYTGQESQDEREKIRKSKPDILLTNFMMLELLMTRQNERDRDVIRAAEGLDFLVLDELHTYRGRQGADVAMLARRVCDRLCRDKPPIFIGTSATMSREKSDERRAADVAAVASRLFGAAVDADAVIDESLARATDPTLTVEKLGDALARAVDAEIPSALSDAELLTHPLAVWIELRIGLDDGRRLLRRDPITVAEAARRLSEASGRPEDLCRSRLQSMLTLMSRPSHERGGEGDRAFLAFKLHRFISGAGHAYATLREPGRRSVTLDGQLYDPEDPEARLFSTHFCRACGQEYHPVTLERRGVLEQFLPRSIDDTPIETPDEDLLSGYLMPEPVDDADFDFEGEPEDYPEEWREDGPRGLRLKSDKRRFAPRLKPVRADGAVDAGGRRSWFIPGKFRFCLACGDTPAGQAREFTKLASLSAEGRSSATTLLVSSALRWMNRQGDAVPEGKRKLLSFTDNRQDAALQAGHFNDFLFVSLLRAATLAAVRAAGPDGLGDDDIGACVQKALGFELDNALRRREWMLESDVKGHARLEAGKTIARVLWHRVWSDQRRGWRYTNPNLEQLGLVRAEYLSLDDLAKDDDAFAAAPDMLRGASRETRERALTILLDVMRQGLALTTEALDPVKAEQVAGASRNALRAPWSIGAQETLRTAAALMVDAPRRGVAGVRDEGLIIRGGARSSLARELNRIELWGRRLPTKDYGDLVHALLAAAQSYGLVASVPTAFDIPGWRLAASAVRFVAGAGASAATRPNAYFSALYGTLAEALLRGGEGLFGLEGREHTAQVDQDRRKWREWRFRWGAEDRERLVEAKDRLRQADEPDDFLPVLFCSPTMELGVDISALNAVYLRNVPPTPANYAQRAGRAGRSGQAALVVTYCSAQGPHDQYYFKRQNEMVSGVVRPPALDLANRELIESHLHAVWLGEAQIELAGDIPHVLELKQEKLPVRSDTASTLDASALRERSAATMSRILDAVATELTPTAAPWAQDRKRFAEAVAAEALPSFSKAFDRWRQLYEGARKQLEEANKRSEMHGLTADERKEVKSLQAQANEQLYLLERGEAGASSDFYTYRYLATEGFLPGYNFPRLPLYAFVPAVGSQGGKAAYLQRARFLAIAEFGPHSLIYHEGRAYRVHKARLPTTARTSESRLVTTQLFVCNDCGAAHPHEPERCHACDAPMANLDPIRKILRINNVETVAAERITANDEERQRRGFEIQTVFSWPMRDAQLDVETAMASDAEGPALRIDYAPGALISRINKGLRRRKNRNIFGFGIKPASGEWTRGPEDDDDGEAERAERQRVVPIVEDNKNAALLRVCGAPLGPEAMTTLQHALARGIDIVFQLEEGETLSEPTPGQDNRRAILIFEATEGGAGVLSRLIGEPDTLARVARKALELMHFKSIDAAVAAADPALLTDEADADCVKGCYRCLLSYYNQPDHEGIDRSNEQALRLLLRLARSKVAPLASAPAGDPWRDAIARWKLPAPDALPLPLDGALLPLVWRSRLTVASIGALSDSQRAALGPMGYELVVLPPAPGASAPEDLAALLGGDD